MQQQFNGSVVSGEFSEQLDEFYVFQIKHLVTQSTMSKKQLEQLRTYLQKHSEMKESCTITVNDQLPILIQPDEVDTLRHEIEMILGSL